MEKVICKAEFGFKNKILLIMSVIIAIIGLILIQGNIVYFKWDHSADIPALLLFNLLRLVLIILPVYLFELKSFVNRCNLTLSEIQIIGELSKLGSTKKIQIPIEKLDNVYTQKNILDVLRGGITVVICSNSGAIKFHCIHNAEKFVAAALKQIEEYKKNIESHSAEVSAKLNNSVNNVINSSSAQKIKEIKDLLDSGLITQEEFEAKRKELLDKM